MFASSMAAISELPDHADLGFQPVTELPLHGFLRQLDQRAHIRGGRAADVDDDVRVPLEDLGVAVDVALEAALVDEPTCTDALDLLEYGSSARVEPEIRVSLVAPGEVLHHDALELRNRRRLEPEDHVEHDIIAVVEDAVVVAELEVIEPDRPDVALL